MSLLWACVFLEPSAIPELEGGVLPVGDHPGCSWSPAAGSGEVLHLSGQNSSSGFASRAPQKLPFPKAVFRRLQWPVR